LSSRQKETPQIYTDETDKKKQVAGMWLRITTSECPISFSLSLTQQGTPQIYTGETDKKKIDRRNVVANHDDKLKHIGHDHD